MKILLRLLGSLVGPAVLYIIYPVLQPMEASPGMMFIAFGFLGLSWLSGWFSLVGFLDRPKGTPIFVFFRITLSLAYVVAVAYVTWKFARFPSFLSPTQLFNLLAIITGVYIFGLVLNAGIKGKVTQVEHNETSLRSSLGQLKGTIERLAYAAPKQYPNLVAAIEKIQETLKFTSPLATTEALALEEQIANGLSYLEQVYRAPTLDQALQDECLRTLQETQNKAVQRSRMKIST